MIEYRDWVFTDNIQISNLEKKYFEDPWNMTMLSDFYLSNGFTGFVADIDGVVVGYICARILFWECEINLVAVDDQFRRKGIATNLFQMLEEKCIEKNVDKILLEVRRSNTSAQALYERLGYKYIGVREGYYSGREDALVMSKLL